MRSSPAFDAASAGPPVSAPLDLSGRRLLITGGTGFLGRSWLDYLGESAARHGAGFHATVLSRDPAAFLARCPEYAGRPWLSFVQGDLRRLPDAPAGYTDVLHGAADTHRAGADAIAWLDQLVEGTRRVLDHAVATGAERFLLVSSGAVYGAAPPDGAAVGEDSARAPLPVDASAVYAHGKRMAETLCALYTAERRLPCVIARCFAVLSPYVPLDGPYAAGNFLRDALAPDGPGARIAVRGDGTAVRTYLGGRDMAHWSFTLLRRGAAGEAYNMGGERPVSTLELARTIGRLLAPARPVVVEKALAAGPRSVYVPAIDKARALGLAVESDLEQAVLAAARALRAPAPAEAAA